MPALTPPASYLTFSLPTALDTHALINPSFPRPFFHLPPHRRTSNAHSSQRRIADRQRIEEETSKRIEAEIARRVEAALASEAVQKAIENRLKAARAKLQDEVGRRCRSAALATHHPCIGSLC